ncbi:MAG: hypothetical protein CTY22_10010 [Methylomonas sp.]|nr:MAG: hypothetical protein CTY22_10010 [Methylomonas sp.]PPD34318.1 MAG: hypothetical protein CTY21_09990 [Methylomonas sp.]PPD42386.1 MAG: hypothetical protein CTY17_01195 [Methylomonas sp.]PPD53096.1 MAG: hypothetical protein CTY11_07275 [Methylomonas sp.]
MNDVVGVNWDGSLRNQQDDRYFSNSFMVAMKNERVSWVRSAVSGLGAWMQRASLARHAAIGLLISRWQRRLVLAVC